MFGGILGYIFGGLVIGVLARLIKPGADPIGWILTLVLGIAGAVIGGDAQLFQPEAMDQRRFGMADRIADHFGIGARHRGSSPSSRSAPSTASSGMPSTVK